MIFNTVLNKNDFMFFQEVITRESGIQIPETKFSLVQARLMRRMRSLNIATYTDYRNFLDENYYDEIENFVNCITTNKTEFFREKHHFEFMTESLFEDYRKQKKKKIRIWSAGCSTGEEPYSIAITCNSFFEKNEINDLKILATDIDTDVLQKAEKGTYPFESISFLEDKIVNKFFSRNEPDSDYFTVAEYLKANIRFRKLNLLNDRFPMKGPFDIIFCRNVIIYFDKASQKKLFTNIYNLMHENSYLFIGHSESLNDMSNMFKLVGRSIYRKVI
ncbi:MAG: protein-glutamate O-methyltransferase CheR [Spirochaetes bacterium]|nr:protein-glutamate O-methyltransferase CheR [Spirochaetota bacterium]